MLLQLHASQLQVATKSGLEVDSEKIQKKLVSTCNTFYHEKENYTNQKSSLVEQFRHLLYIRILAFSSLLTFH